ncbi:MAG: hypothetical protein JXB85_17970 [Anaerolineales bacterium]|nr:hypothetical protein [Anaerolineales bacterium]
MSSENGTSDKRGPWYLIFGLAIGIGLGLLIAWAFIPVTYVNTSPRSLRADFKDSYRVLIASAYTANGDLGRAQARLDLLGDEDPAAALADQALLLADVGDPEGAAFSLAALAGALGVTVDLQLPGDDAAGDPDSTGSGRPTATRRPTVTPTPLFTSTPRPTRTSTPTPGAAFALVFQEEICNLDLAPGLLQIEVRDAASQPVAGVEILITWEGHEERIFTGLKPELGNGYADFDMDPELVYSLQFADGGPPTANLSASLCTVDGESFWGGLRLVFSQP